MTNATAFWGTMTNCNAASPSGSGTQTCNGNGDGKIAAASAPARTGEAFGIWQQLANAGLIEGSYTGIAGPTTNGYDTVLGENTPRSKISNVGWSTHLHGNYTGINEPQIFAVDLGNNLTIGIKLSAGINEGKAFRPEEAWNIDLKMDDGKLGTGNMIIRYWNECTDAASNGYATVSDRTGANYALNVTSKECGLYFPKWL